MILILWMTFGYARPYYVTEIDFEQDYYYNARSAFFGLPTTYHHPGTPVHELGRIMLWIVGPELSRTQLFCNLGYLVVGVATSASLWWFSRSILRTSRKWVSLPAVASVVAWPPFLYYLNFFGAESFLTAAGLVVLVLFWRLLDTPVKPAGARLLALGAVVGASLALKMTFVPVAAALLVAIVVARWNAASILAPAATRRKKSRTVAIEFGTYVVGVSAACTVLTLPILPVTLRVWYRSLSRGDAHLPSTDWSSALYDVAGVLGRSNGLYLAMTVAVGSGALAMLAWHVSRSRVHRMQVRGTQLAQPFDFAAGGTFFVVLSAAMLYTAVAASAFTEVAAAGVRLRNMTPAALVIPFALLYVDRLSARHAWVPLDGRWARLTANLVALFICTLGVSNHLRERTAFVRTRLARIEATTAQFAQPRVGGGRMAFWTESNQDFLGAASFHFWGNFRYANGAFDDSVLEEFPSFTLLHLTTIGNVYARNDEAARVGDSAGRTRSRFGALGDAAWRARNWLAGPTDPASGGVEQLFAGEKSGVRVTSVAFPVEEMHQLRGMGRSRFVAIMRDSLHVATERIERVADVDWFVMSSDGAAVQGSGRGAIDGARRQATLSASAPSLVTGIVPR